MGAHQRESMVARSIRMLMLFALSGAMFAGAQSTRSGRPPKPKIITVRVLDGRTGERITPDNVVVRIDRHSDNSVDWVKLDDDGTATLTLPAATTSFSVHATYENGTEYYVNCDVSKQREMARDTWYPVDGVLAEGLVMPNECDGSKKARDMKITAKPGEFILLVRKHAWRDHIGDIR